MSWPAAHHFLEIETVESSEFFLNKKVVNIDSSVEILYICLVPLVSIVNHIKFTENGCISMPLGKIARVNLRLPLLALLDLTGK